MLLPDWMKRLKPLSGFLVCLCLIMPFSAWAVEPSGGASHSSPPAVKPFFSNDGTIWVAGVGEGFHPGTQVIGFSAGITHGMLMLGGNERHHLSLLSATYGQMIGGVKGSDRWYRGNWELLGELSGGAQVNGETRWLTGITPHIRYHFATGTRFVSYVDAGIGVTLTDIRGPDLGSAFQFNLQAGMGVNYFIRDNLAINIEGRYLHISSAGTSMPNDGVNTIGGFLGINTYF